MATLVANRLVGALLAGPSFFMNINILNLIACNFKSTGVQYAIICATFLSIVGDICIASSVSAVIIDSKISVTFAKMAVVIMLLKRTYSVVTVYVACLRFDAIQSIFEPSHRKRVVYRSIYCVLTTAAGLTHLMSYYMCEWDSSATRNSVLFKYVHRPINFIACMYYLVMVVITDFLLLQLRKRSAFVSLRYKAVRMFYNMDLYVIYESLAFLAFVVFLFWSLADIDMTASFYLEQFLLTVISLNCCVSIRNLTNVSSNSELTAGTSDSFGADKPSQTSPTQRSQGSPTSPATLYGVSRYAKTNEGRYESANGSKAWTGPSERFLH
jgi:hypothetical protein